MPPSLLINADDFGLTAGVNRGIRELHELGALRSATLMATGAAFADAVRTAGALPDLRVGCHVVLTDGTPVSKPADIPSLLGPDRRRFRPSLLDFVAAVLRGAVQEAEVEREAAVQIARLQGAGISVSHVDTHKHTHLLPGVLRPLLRALEARGVRAIRNPFERGWSLRLGHGGPLRRSQILLLRAFRSSFFAHPLIRSGRIRTTDGTLGISATGLLDEPTLRQLMEHLPAGTWELVCHPGYNDRDLAAITTRLRTQREVEMGALGAVIPSLAALPGGPRLIDFKQLADAPGQGA